VIPFLIFSLHLPDVVAACKPVYSDAAGDLFSPRTFRPSCNGIPLLPFPDTVAAIVVGERNGNPRALPHALARRRRTFTIPLPRKPGSTIPSKKRAIFFKNNRKIRYLLSVVPMHTVVASGGDPLSS
jgi:hypothetical protein